MKHALLVILCLMSLVVTGCASLSAEPIAARVVDAGTDQPLPGVVVVAYWELHRGSFTGDALPCGAANVEEAVTDENGRFNIPAWGPVNSSCDMRIWNPVLIFFKPGYEPKALNNDTVNPLEMVSVSRSNWDGKTIELHRHSDMDLRATGIDSYAAEFSELNTHALSFVVDYAGQCNWKRVPNMLRAVMVQQRLFNEAGTLIGSIASELVSGDSSMQTAAPQCGSPKAFVEGLEK